MATTHWRGDAPAIAQVTTATPANVEIGDQFLLTINGKSVRYTATVATVADVIAGLVAAAAATTIPEFAEVAATDTTTEVTLTAKTPGRPFVATGSAINGGATDDQSLTVATTTASSGPNHWDTAANWSTGSVPSSADDVYIENSEVSILYGLEQSSVNLSNLNILASFTGEIGLSAVNQTGTSDYAEYRQRDLAIGATSIDIGRGSGDGSGRIQIDSGSTATALTIHNTGIATENDLPAMLWKGGNAGNTLNMIQGDVGVALLGGDSATISTLRQSSGNLRVGEGVTLTTIERSGGGHLVFQSAATTLSQSGGETSILGSGTIGTINLDGGRVNYNSSGTISTATVDGQDAILDFSEDLRARTVTNMTLRQGIVLDPHETVTWTNGIQPESNIQAI